MKVLISLLATLAAALAVPVEISRDYGLPTAPVLPAPAPITTITLPVTPPVAPSPAARFLHPFTHPVFGAPPPAAPLVLNRGRFAPHPFVFGAPAPRVISTLPQPITPAIRSHAFAIPAAPAPLPVAARFTAPIPAIPTPVAAPTPFRAFAAPLPARLPFPAIAAPVAAPTPLRAFAAPLPARLPVHAIAAPVAVAPSSQFHSQDDFGNFNFGFQHHNQAKQESTVLGVTTGSYSYVDANGIVQRVDYTADDVNGFRVAATNLPVVGGPLAVAALAGPVETPEVQAARAAHLQAHADALAAADAPVAPAEAVRVALPIHVAETPEVAEARAAHLKAVEEAKKRNKRSDDYIPPAPTAIVPVAAPIVPAPVPVAAPIVRAQFPIAGPIFNHPITLPAALPHLLRTPFPLAAPAAIPPQFLRTPFAVPVPTLRQHLDARGVFAAPVSAQLPVPAIAAPVAAPTPLRAFAAPLPAQLPLRAIAAPIAVAPAIPTSQFHAQDDFGNTHFGFQTANHAKQESTVAGITTGSYSYVDANGIVQRVDYTADDVNGFRVAATNLPVVSAAGVPLVAPQETPEVMAARQAHLEAHAAAATAAAAAIEE